MRNRHKFGFIIGCAIIDMVALVLGTVMFLKYATDGVVSWNALFANKMIPITILSWLFSVTYFRLYRVKVLFNLENFFRNTWRAFLTQRILWYSYLFFFYDDSLYFFRSEANLMHLSFLLFYFLLSRIVFTLVIVKIKKWVVKRYSVAIWGFNKTSIELAAHLETNSYFIHFIGILNENSSVNYETQESFSMALTEAIHKASEANISELYIVAKPDFISDLNYFFELGDKLCMHLKFVPDFSSISKQHFSVAKLNNFHVILPRNEPLQNAYNRLVKRAFDIVFSTLVIVFILSWLYPLLAFIINKQSKGPVLFRQMRTGIKNQPFWCEACI